MSGNPWRMDVWQPLATLCGVGGARKLRISDLRTPSSSITSSSPSCSSRRFRRFPDLLLGRIDLHVDVPALPFASLAEMPPGLTLADLRGQVLETRARQAKRFGPRGPQVNGRMMPRQVRKFCELYPEAMALLEGGDGRRGPVGSCP